MPHVPRQWPQAFTEVLANNETWAVPMEDTYAMLDIDPASVQGLEDYLKVCWLAGWALVWLLAHKSGAGVVPDI